MQTGIIRKRGSPRILGRWRADGQSIIVDTDDPALRSASDQILRTPQQIPIHGAERHEFAAHAESLIETPSTIKYLALFALELEERGFVPEVDEE
jgi:hypothetical protein